MQKEGNDQRTYIKVTVNGENFAGRNTENSKFSITNYQFHSNPIMSDFCAPIFFSPTVHLNLKP